jgi:hypothetical protein
MAPVDPREIVIAEMRKQTALLGAILELAGILIHRSHHDAAPAQDDRLCDGPHGDPIIKAKDPRDWSGEPMTGRTFSECPPEYLDLLAERYAYFAEKETDDKKAGYNRLDARRARAWAARLRSGWNRPTPDAGGFASDDPGF